MATTSDSLRSLSDRALKTTESLLTKPMSVFGNSYFKNFALVLLILYAPVAAPMISPNIVNLLGNYAAKLIYVFVLAYLLSGSIRVSVVTSVVLVLGIFLLKKFRHDGEHLSGDVSKNEKEIPTEPVVNRFEVTRTGCDVAGSVEPNPLDNVTQNNAKADHEDALHPETLKDMQPVSQAQSDDYEAYDDSASTQSLF
jgi:hypothetical protein